MKKAFTLLLLAVLIFMPRTMHAEIVWQTATGNEWRINPDNPGDPNDSIRLAPGTKFFYLVPETRSASPFTANPVLKDRVLVRFLGYNYVSHYAYTWPEMSGGNKVRNYCKKLIMTEEEALAVKKLDLNPRTYGLSSSESYHDSYFFSSDLAVFSNVEEIDFSYMRLPYKPGSSWQGNHFEEIANSFPKLKRLTMSLVYIEAWEVEEFWKEINFSALKNLEYLHIDGNHHVSLRLENMPNLKTVVIGGTDTYKVVNFRNITIRNCPQLTKIDASAACYSTMDCSNNVLEELYPGVFESLFCQNNNLKTLHVFGPDEFFGGDFAYFWYSPGPDRDPNFYRHDHIHYFSYGGVLNCSNNQLESLILESPDYFKTIECRRNNLTSLNLPNAENLKYIDCSENNITSLNFPSSPELEQIFCWNNNLSELDVTSCPKLWRLGMSNNKISSLDLSKNEELKVLYCNNNRLTELDCSGLKYLEELQASQNRLTELDMSGCSALKTLYCDAQGGYDGRLLRKLDLTGCTSLYTLHCQNNALLSLNLSDCPGLSASKVQGYTQRGVEDVTVLDQDKVCIELPNGVTTGLAQTYNSLFDLESDNLYVTWENSGFEKERNRIVQKGDKTYLVIHDISDDARGGAQAKRDVDFYGKKLRYQYVLQANNFQETLGGSAAHGKKNDNITVTVYPYVMYINPATEDLFTTPAAPFYSGTIYLDYDAVVPEGTEVYVATGMQLDKTDMLTGGENTTSGQLNLVKLTPGVGATHVVIPALTPVYVKSPDETGLFAFSRNLANEPLASVPSGNIFKGTLTDKTVEPLSVLTLSKGRKQSETGYTSESRVGFWRYTKTTVPAHRVYIDASELENLGGRDARGMTFNFFDSESEMLTALEGLNAGSPQQPTLNNAGWYTPSGLRLNGQPTEKGVYIRNGKKVMK